MRPELAVRLARRRFLVLAAGLLGVGASACSPAAPAAAPTPTPAPAPPSSSSSSSSSSGAAQSGPGLALSPPPAVLSPAPSTSPVAVGGPPEMANVTISYDSPSAPSIFVLIAVAQHIPETYGVTLHPTYVDTTNATAGLLSGELHVAQEGGTGPIEAITAGAPLKILSTFEDVNGYAIFAGPSISQPSDLKGKSIAIAERGSNPDLGVRAALGLVGLSVDKDVNEVLLGNDAQRLAAVVAGNADAAILDEGSFGPQAQAQGLHVVISLTQQKLAWVGDAPVVSASFAQQFPNTVYAVLKGLIDGIRYYKDDAHRDVCVPIIAQSMQLAPDDPLASDFYQSHHTNAGVFSPQPGTVNILQALQGVDPSKYGNVDPSQMLDTSFMQQLVASGFVTLDA